MRTLNTAEGKRRRAPRLAAVAAAALAALLCAGTANADAAVRYAAPGGNNEPGSECPQTHPCSLFNAASRFGPESKLDQGDEVLVESGTYSDASGDLGPTGLINPAAHVSIHGIAGQPRPVVTASNASGAFAFTLDEPGVTLGRLEIRASAGAGAWSLDSPSSVIDGVVAVSSGTNTPCFVSGGLVRNSVCLATGPGGVALSAFSFLSPQATVELRNVTAIATGTNSRGLVAAAEVAGKALDVDGVGVLAKGTFKDVLGRTANTADVTAALSHSDFATTGLEAALGGGHVTLPKPGSGEGNITAAPLLAADGYHELPGSPTVDAGAVDESSGTADVDGNARSIGAAPDIGADELQLASTTSLSCDPAGAAVGDRTTCTATVSAAGGAPTGTVRFATDGRGAFGGGGSCTLAPAGKGGSACHLSYTPSAVGNGRHDITASYQGDAFYLASQDSATVRVLTKSQATPNTTLKKKPLRRSARREATFAFASSLAGSRFECKLDRKRFKACRSPLKLKGLKLGRHTLRVRAVGPTGIADPTPASFRWRVSSG